MRWLRTARHSRARAAIRRRCPIWIRLRIAITVRWTPGCSRFHATLHGACEIDALSERARNNYLLARALTGCDYGRPSVSWPARGSLARGNLWVFEAGSSVGPSPRLTRTIDEGVTHLPDMRATCCPTLSARGGLGVSVWPQITHWLADTWTVSQPSRPSSGLQSRKASPKRRASCGLSSSVVTARIQQLEDFVGAPLFHRNTRSVRLSEFGQAFLRDCAELVGRTNEVVDQMRDVDDIAAGTPARPRACRASCSATSRGCCSEFQAALSANRPRPHRQRCGDRPGQGGRRLRLADLPAAFRGADLAEAVSRCGGCSAPRPNT